MPNFDGPGFAHPGAPTNENASGPLSANLGGRESSVPARHGWREAVAVTVAQLATATERHLDDPSSSARAVVADTVGGAYRAMRGMDPKREQTAAELTNSAQDMQLALGGARDMLRDRKAITRELTADLKQHKKVRADAGKAKVAAAESHRTAQDDYRKAIEQLASSDPELGERLVAFTLAAQRLQKAQDLAAEDPGPEASAALTAAIDAYHRADFDVRQRYDTAEPDTQGEANAALSAYRTLTTEAAQAKKTVTDFRAASDRLVEAAARKSEAKDQVANAKKTRNTLVKEITRDLHRARKRATGEFAKATAERDGWQDNKERKVAALRLEIFQSTIAELGADNVDLAKEVEIYELCGEVAGIRYLLRLEELNQAADAAENLAKHAPAKHRISSLNSARGTSRLLLRITGKLLWRGAKLTGTAAAKSMLWGLRKTFTDGKSKNTPEAGVSAQVKDSRGKYLAA